MPHDARPSPVTTATGTYFLNGLKDAANETVWRQYVDRYRPLVVGYARRLGVDEADADDVAQQTLVAFATAYQRGSYQRDKGRLRDWLFGIARRQLQNCRRRRMREARLGAGDGSTGALDRIGDEDQLKSIWEQEWRDDVLRQCIEQVRGEIQAQTYEAFELFACRGWPAQRVAERLGMTENAVFSAKRRVLHRIRELGEIIDDA